MKYLITLMLLTITFASSASDLQVTIPAQVVDGKTKQPNELPFSVNHEGLLTCSSDCWLTLKMSKMHDSGKSTSLYVVCGATSETTTCTEGYMFKAVSYSPNPVTVGHNVLGQDSK